MATKGMNTRCKRVAALLTSALMTALATSLPGPATAQVNRGIPPLESPDPGRTPSQGLANAAIYFDLPVRKFMEAVPEIKGLKYEPSQDQLPQILASVAKTIGDVLPRLPDLVSREVVYHFQDARSEQPWNREFKYLILSHHNRDGSTTIEESRTDGKGRPIDLSGPSLSPQGYGFAYQWLLFSAANQADFRFRYMGQQDKDGRKTFVVAFAQNPAKVIAPGSFKAGQAVAPFFYQGVLWVDQSSFDIVQLRSDLLAPIPSLQLRQLTTDLKFQSVPIHGYDAVFWLPSELHIVSDQGNGPAEESHRYSDYHLFHSTARILPAQ